PAPDRTLAEVARNPGELRISESRGDGHIRNRVAAARGAARGAALSGGERRTALCEYERSGDSGGAGAGDRGHCLDPRFPAASHGQAAGAIYLHRLKRNVSGSYAGGSSADL